MRYIEKMQWGITPSLGGSVFLWGMINSVCYLCSAGVTYTMILGLGRNGTGQHLRKNVRAICVVRMIDNMVCSYHATTLCNVTTLSVRKGEMES